MKKIIFASMVVVLLLALYGAQEQKEAKPDFLKNLQTVEKIEPVPSRLATGLDSIKAEEMMAMLAFLSSDNLEGREIGSRGYDTAAAYAVSLFSIWGLKPGGDMAKAAPVSGRQMGSPPPAAAKPVPRGDAAQGIGSADRSFLQEFELKEALESTAAASLQTVRPNQARRGQSFAPGVDFIFSSYLPLEIDAPLVFAGYGISEKSAGYDDLAGVDLRDKIVIILSEAPGKEDSASPFQKKGLKEKYFPAMPVMRGGGADYAKTSEIFKRGALAVLVVKNSLAEGGDVFRDILAERQVHDDKPILPDNRKRLILPGSKALPWEGRTVLRVSRDMANAILATANETVESLQAKIAAKYKPHSLAIPNATLQVSNQVRYGLLKSANVVGIIEGSDPQLKGQALVIGGHLDHLGRRGEYIYNGAEDNGSGVCGVLAIARALALNPEKPKRSIVFCLWTGEEEGLFGSRYYAAHPAFALNDTVAYLNLDMIAQPWSEAGLRRMTRMMNVADPEALLKKIKPENFLPLAYAFGALELRNVMSEANRCVGFDILYRESAKTLDRMMGGSDHATFAMANTPWVFFMSGMSDVYHTPGDSLEKFNGETMAKIGRLVYLAAFLLADK
jgi:hypothetical protein